MQIFVVLLLVLALVLFLAASAGVAAPRFNLMALGLAAMAAAFLIPAAQALN